MTLTFFQFYKFGILLWPAMDTPDKVWISTTLAFAVVCKMADYHAMRANDISLYRRSHARAAGIEPRVGRVARTDALRSRVRARRVAVLVARLAATGLRLVHHLFVGPQHPMCVGVVAFIGARASRSVCAWRWSLSPVTELAVRRCLCRIPIRSSRELTGSRRLYLVSDPAPI